MAVVELIVEGMVMVVVVVAAAVAKYVRMLRRLRGRCGALFKEQIASNSAQGGRGV